MNYRQFLLLCLLPINDFMVIFYYLLYLVMNIINDYIIVILIFLSSNFIFYKKQFPQFILNKFPLTETKCIGIFFVEK